MISRPEKDAYVWVWLPGAVEPVVAGRLSQQGEQLQFNYGKSYLQRDNAIALYDRELPLQQGYLPLLPGLSMPGCLRDASPDAWGRRVIINKALGLKGVAADSATLDELTYLLESGSDRIGARFPAIRDRVMGVRGPHQADCLETRGQRDRFGHPLRRKAGVLSWPPGAC